MAAASRLHALLRPTSSVAIAADSQGLEFGCSGARVRGLYHDGHGFPHCDVLEQRW